MGATVITDEHALDGGPGPLGATYGKMMMWFFILSDALTFSGFLAAYGFSRFKFIDFYMYSIENRIRFFNDFNDIVLSGPLNYQEQYDFKNQINMFLKEDKHEDDGVLKNNNAIEDDNDNYNDEKSYVEENSSIIILKGNRKIRSSTLTHQEISEYYQSIDLSKAHLCSTCLRLKIERSHHCRQCGKCVLKMDHHCPWLANCIGFRNYKYFLLIQFYGVILSLIILLTFWETLIGYNIRDDTNIFNCWLVLFIYFCNLGLFGFVLWMTLINWTLMINGSTVIENSDRERFPLNKNINIYDLGYFKNFLVVFGKNPFFWFLPFCANTKGEGVIYNTIYDKFTG